MLRSILARCSGCIIVQCIEDVRKDKLVNIRSPQEIEMFVVWNLLGHGMSGQLFQHDLDVNKTVTAAIDQHNRRLDVACWEFGDFVVFCACCNRERSLDFVVVHLERAISNDLKPVHNRLCTAE